MRHGISYEVFTQRQGAALGEAQIAGVKKCSVLNMQWQLEKVLGSLWAENLRCAGSITDRLVVTKCRIVLKTGLFEDLGRGSIETQPMHPDTQVRLLRDFRQPAVLFTTLVGIVPGVDSMDSNFMAHVI